MTGADPFPPIPAMVRAVRSGEVAPGHWVARSLERVRASEAGEGRLNAFLSVRDGEDGEKGASPAEDGDRPGEGGDRPGRDGGRALDGVPVAVKDNLATLELPTTCASRILDGYRSPFEATAVRRLRAAGAVTVGKTNMDEFGMGSSTENSAFGPTRNPLDGDRVPGGSSGGSAVAVAAGVVPAALGSDTGGSVRQPASFCGVVGIKPTYGRVSRYGLVAFASSLDQVGTLGRTVEDAALLLEAVAGQDSLDATSAARRVPDLAAALARAEEGLEGLVVGVPEEYFPASLDPGVDAVCREALDRLEALGARLRPVSLPHTDAAVPAYYVLAPAEASSNLARYDGVRFGLRAEGARSTRDVYEATRSAGFGPEVTRRIILGTYALSAGYYDQYYGRAQKVRTVIARELEACFAGGVDLLYTPTSPTVAFRRGERTEDPYSMYLADVFTVPANLAGLPALSLPVGRWEGLPVGGQLMAPPWGEETMVRAAAALEGILAESEGVSREEGP